MSFSLLLISRMRSSSVSGLGRVGEPFDGLRVERRDVSPEIAQVPPMYWRVLSLLCMVIGVCLMWMYGVPIFGILVFAFPMWILVLSLKVRVVPFIVPPRLELRDSGGFTTLGLLNRAREENHIQRMS
jgi:hypothetical protein